MVISRFSVYYIEVEINRKFIIYLRSMTMAFYKRIKLYHKLIIFAIIMAFALISDKAEVCAKSPSTFDIELKDLGDGFYVPSTYDYKDENGNIAMVNIDVSVWDMQEISLYDFLYPARITLENGHILEKYYSNVDEVVHEYIQKYYRYEGDRDETYYDTLKSIKINAYPECMEMDENGVVLFHVGKQLAGNIDVCFGDAEGYGVSYNFSHDVTRSRGVDENGNKILYWETEIYSKPDSFYINDKEDRELRIYQLSYAGGEEVYKLAQKNEYDENHDLSKVSYYSLGRYNDEPYDREDEEYLEEWMYAKDIVSVGLDCMINYPLGYSEKDGGVIFREGPGFVNKLLPLVKYSGVDNTELYLLKLKNRLDPALPDDYDAEGVWYFTKEHYDEIVSQGITTYEELLERFPEYLNDEFNAMVVAETRGDPDYKDETELEEEARHDAIIRGDDHTDNADNIDNDTQDEGGEANNYTMRDGGRVWNQKITGDIVPAGGKTPATLETWEQNTPAGTQIKLTVRDENGGIIAVGIGRDLSHTEYKYAYFTMYTLIDDGKVIFEVAGSDDPVSGNFNYEGSWTMDTDNGEQGYDSYMDYDYYNQGE